MADINSAAQNIKTAGKSERKSPLAIYKNLFKNEIVNNLVFFLAPLLFCFVMAICPEVFLKRTVEYFTIHIQYFLITTVIFYFFCLFLTFLTRRLWAGMLLSGLVYFAAGVANYFKLSYRGAPVFPRDIFMIKDALFTVQETMSITPTNRMYAYAIFIMLSVLLVAFVRLPRFAKTGKTRAVRAAKGLGCVALCALLTAGSLFSTYLNSSFMQKKGFGFAAIVADKYYQYSFFGAFFGLVPESIVRVPEGYPEEMDAVNAQLEALATQQGDARQADIIVLTVETWYMLDNYDVTFDVDLFENYNRLAQESTTGFTVPYLYGGGTANIEYELLTGMPSGTETADQVAFNTILYDDFPSLPNALLEQGYSTFAAHPYFNNLYNRVFAYDALGFENAYFNDSFENPELVAEYTSDAACFDFVIQQYEQLVANGAQSVLAHAMTMQNHAPQRMDLLDDALLPAIYSDTITDPELLNYIAGYAYQLIQTDAAIGKLIDYLRTVERDVIVLIVGDHQSEIIMADERAVLDLTGFYDSHNALADYLDLHTTPYLVWANFETDAPETFGNTPHNMLLVNALVEYDVARPVYFDYLYQNTTTMNGTTGGFTVNLDGSISLEKTEAQQEEQHKLDLLWYDIVYGKKLSGAYLYR